MPDDVRAGMRRKLWAFADTVDWSRLSWGEKSAHYEAWTRDPEVGGQLGHYMDQRRVRVYIKDTVMKGYGRSRLADPSGAMRVLGILPIAPAKEYERPHGRLLADGRVIAWGKAKDWKAILMSIHERAFESKEGRPYGAVLSSAVGRFTDDNTRRLVADAAKKLGIEKLVWL
ncbi:MAG: hypothetical protein Q8P41_29895 [Pseudomonadota bacterium]|nr:hypothetical protein [Pseudomonadota bacterium]